MAKGTWSLEQETLLQNFYLTSTNEELAQLFPEKTQLAIYKKARKMGFYKLPSIKSQNKSNAKKLPTEKHKQRITTKKYVMLYRPNHPRSDANGYVMEHIVVFEEATGVSVPINCAIHHINGDKKDNRIENLCMMERGAHTTLHNLGRVMSDDCKRKIGEKTKSRLANPHNHPLWKDIDIDSMKREVENGAFVKDVCKKYGIDKTTYYKRLRRKNESKQNFSDGQDNKAD